MRYLFASGLFYCEEETEQVPGFTVPKTSGALTPASEHTVIMNLTGEPEATGWELPAVVAIAIFGLVCLLYLLAFLYTLCCQRCGPAGPAGGQLCEENEEATFHPSSPLCAGSSGPPDLAGLGSASTQAS